MTTTQTTRTKETRMPTKTIPAPTAAEARALADRLEAQERDLTTRRRAARKAAELAAAKAEFGRADTDLAEARNSARERYMAAADADTLDVAALFAAWVDYRAASRRYATTIASANAAANAIEPIYGQGGGQVDHRRDWTDLTADVAFSAELDAIVEKRVSRVTQETTDETNTRIRQAGDEAAEAIQ